MRQCLEPSKCRESVSEGVSEWFRAAYEHIMECVCHVIQQCVCRGMRGAPRFPTASITWSRVCWSSGHAVVDHETAKQIPKKYARAREWAREWVRASYEHIWAFFYYVISRVPTQQLNINTQILRCWTTEIPQRSCLSLSLALLPSDCRRRNLLQTFWTILTLDGSIVFGAGR